LFLEGGRGLTCAGGLEGVVRGARADREPAWVICGVGAGGTLRARPTVSAGEGAVDDGLAVLVVRWLPLDTGVPRRVGRPLRVPVQGKVGHVAARGRACLPRLIARHGPTTSTLWVSRLVTTCAAST